MKKLSLCCVCLILLTACQTKNKPESSIEVAVKGLHSAALSESGSLATVGSIYHGGSMWRTSDAERLFNWNHNSEEPTTIVATDFSDDGLWSLTSNPHTMVLWNVTSGKGERYWTAPAEVLDVELNARASLALLGLADHTAVIFDIRRGGIRRVFNHGNRVRSVDFSADGRTIITGSEDYSATIWDANSGEQISRIMHEQDVQLVKLSDDASLALSVSKYDKALIWNPTTAEKIAEVPLHAERLKRGLHFTAARFSKNNQYLLTGRPDQVVQLWRVADMQQLAIWELPKRDRWKPTGASVLDLSFTESETVFRAVASNGFIHTLHRNTALNE